MAGWLNGEMVDDSQLIFREDDLGIARGYGVFDYFLSTNGIPFFLHDHLDRFFYSAEGMHLPVPFTREAIIEAIAQMLRPFDKGMAYIKIMLTGGPSTYGEPVTAPTFFVKVGPYASALQSTSFRMVTVPYQRELPEYKHTNYAYALWLQPSLRQRGADDALYVREGFVTELPRSSFFMVSKEGVLITPDKNVLPGVTRKHVIALAQKIMPVSLRPVTVDEVHHAAEIFITSTTKGIMPVAAVDNKPIGNGAAGPITQQLAALLQEYKQLQLAAFQW